MEESALSSKWRTFKVGDSLSRGRIRKTWNEVIRSDLKERKVNKDIIKDKNAWKSFIRNRYEKKPDYYDDIGHILPKFSQNELSKNFHKLFNVR